MNLPNRVDPFGQLWADPSRGLFMGNRGGRFHHPDGTLGARRFASPQWICCLLAFRGRQRRVWSSRSYTELFFLDEPTALAAGHRPCFECRRNDALDFAQRWAGRPVRPRAAEMDQVLHAERLAPSGPLTFLDDLPDAALFTFENAPEEAYAVRGETILRWRFGGYARPQSRPRGVEVRLITPRSIVAVLRNGYRPVWHPTAD